MAFSILGSSHRVCGCREMSIPTQKKQPLSRRSEALSPRGQTKSSRAKDHASAVRPQVRRFKAESRVALEARAARILVKLRAAYPDATCALHHRSALELLVATILSAQCTDQRVNLVTPALFARYCTPADFAAAPQEELEAAIRSTGFFRNKAKSLIGMGRRVSEEYDGNIPDTMEALLTLPGVARKTANCVLGTWFRKNDGVVVDTHVGRVSLRLGLLREARDDKDAVRIEQELMKLFPRETWTWLSHALIDRSSLSRSQTAM